MPNSILNSLITHIATELAREGIGFGKTKLVKLIYLVDEESRPRGTRRLSLTIPRAFFARRLIVIAD